MSDTTENSQASVTGINPDIIGGEPSSTGVPARPPVENLSREPAADFIITRDPVQVEPVAEETKTHDEGAETHDKVIETHDDTETHTHDDPVEVPGETPAEATEAVTVDAGATILDQSGEGVVTDGPATVTGDPTVVEVVDSSL